MAPVARFESRTLWGAGGQALTAKFGSSIVIMRGRPAGFGLHVPPAIHRLLTACGIRDASATIEGSRNPQEVLKAAIQILHGGVSRCFMSWECAGFTENGRLCPERDSPYAD
jgi:small subunit ribosomal protein S5